MPQESISDATVVSANTGLVRLLWQLPGELVLDFLERANAWELAHSLSDRLAGTAEMIRGPVELTPALRDRSADIAQRCAEFVLTANTTLGALITQLERAEQGPLRIDWRGTEHVRRARDGGRPVVVFAPHVGLLYAVPVALAALGASPAVLGSEVARDVLLGIFPTLGPRLAERVGYVVVPSPDGALQAVRALTDRRLLVVFPEVNLGATGNLQSATGPFLGRTVWLPTTTARLARIAGAGIVPATVTPEGSRQVRIEFGEPIPPPAHRSEDEATTVALFAWLEQVIERRPHLWWAWPTLDTEMRVTEPAGRSAGRS